MYRVMKCIIKSHFNDCSVMWLFIGCKQPGNRAAGKISYEVILLDAINIKKLIYKCFQYAILTLTCYALLHRQIL